MSVNSSFDPFGVWAKGPWMFFDLSLKFVRSWQEAWFSRMQLMGNPVAPPPTAFSLPVTRPRLGCLDGVEVVGGPQTQVLKPAQAKEVVTKEKKALATPKVLADLPSKLELSEPASTTSSVTSLLAMQARSLSRAVSKTPKPVASGVAKSAPASAKKTAKPASKPVTKKPSLKKA